MEEKDYWIAFSVFSGVGAVTFQQLLTTFGSAKTAWNAPQEEMQKVLKAKKSQDFFLFQQTFDFEKYKHRLEKAHVAVITWDEKTYPYLLKQIPKHPFVLYVKGDPGVIVSEESNIAIVGTRKITQYGRDVTEMFTQSLVHAGYTIISGLAMGVDAVAHKTTIDTGGKTIAVLGCGVDCVYPLENEKLYDEIVVSGGAIISEIPLGMSATVGTFPARNRIVAGMSKGVLVTQGAEDSGSLITAEFGLEYGRKVFAVPGPITSMLSKGPYRLIEKGAHLVTDPKQVLDQLGITGSQSSASKWPVPLGDPTSTTGRKIVGDTKEEQMIIDLLENEPLSFDEIVRKVKRNSSQIASLLSIMEIKGEIKTLTNGNFGVVT